MWVTVAVSSASSASWAARTVTVCGELQSVVPNIRLAGSAVTPELPAGSLMVTVTAAVGWVSSTAVYVCELPSVMVSDTVESVTPVPSSSKIVSAVALVEPELTPSGRVVPMLSLTPSPSSFSVSCVAVKPNVWDVSPESKVTFNGTPE